MSSRVARPVSRPNLSTSRWSASTRVAESSATGENAATIARASARFSRATSSISASRSATPDASGGSAAAAVCARTTMLV